MSSTADYTRDDEANGALFQVVPADSPKFWPLVAVGAAVLYFGFSGVSFLLVFLVAGACFALGWNDLRPIEHRTTTRFRVSPSGIEAFGETFRKADIEEIVVGSGGGSHEEGLLGKAVASVASFQQGKIDEVTHSLTLRAARRSILLAGGLDPKTASSLLAEVKDALGPRQLPAPALGSSLEHTRPGLTVDRVSVGFMGIEVRAFTGDVSADANGNLYLWDGGQGVSLRGEQEYVGMQTGERVSVFWGVRRGARAHNIGRIKLFSDSIHKRGLGEPWGVVSRAIAVTNHSSGADAMIWEPFNRMIVPNRALYNAVGVIVIFGGLFSILGLFSGSPEGIVFLPFAVGSVIWLKRRQRVLTETIRAAAAKLKQPGAPAVSLDHTIPRATGL